MSESITQKQQELLNFIQSYQLDNGRSPTVKEMRLHFGLSSDNSIVKQLKALVKKGYIQKDDTPRGIKLLNVVKENLFNTENFFRLPILGSIPAGGPMLTEEYIESWMSVDASNVKNPNNSFLLRVTGDSMLNAGIFEGDTLIVDADLKPAFNDIVVALVDGGNTVKRYVKQTNGMPYLQAENPDYPDIYPEHDLQIQGVVTGLIRKY